MGTINSFPITTESTDTLAERASPGAGHVISDNGTDNDRVPESAFLSRANHTGQEATADIADNAITNPKLADVAQNTLKGRVTAGSGDPEDLSAAQARTILNVEDGAAADQTGAEIKALYEAEANTNAFDDAALAKLAGVESGATADQTGAEIKAAYEAELNTNAFTDSEKTKLTGIEAGATADQSAGEIKTAYESNANTNAFTDSEQSKLAAIEAGATADQSNAEIETAYNAQVPEVTQGEAEAGVGTAVRRWTPLRVNQAIQALAPGGGGGISVTQLARAPLVTDDVNAGFGVGDIIIDTSADPDEHYRCSDPSAGAAVWIKTTLTADELATVAISGNSDDLTEGATKLLMTSAERTKLTNIETAATADQTGAEIKSLYEAEPNTNAFDDAAVGKLAGIEAGATADQTGAEIKTAYEAELNTNAFTDAEKTKLSGIETGATADQTGAEIKVAYEAEANTNAFTDAEQSKLSAIEAGATADQTGAEIKTAYEAEANTNAFTDAEQTKLSGIAAGATNDAAHVADSSIHFSKESAQRIAFNNQVGTTYTLAASDHGKQVNCTNAAAITVTVPADTMTAGDQVCIKQGGAGQVTVSAAATVTINHPSTTFLAKTLEQYATLVLVCEDDTPGANVFNLSGIMAAV